MRLNAKIYGPSFDMSSMTFETFAKATAEIMENDRIRARNRERESLLASCYKKPKPEPKLSVLEHVYTLQEATEISEPLTNALISDIVGTSAINYAMDESINMIRDYTFSKFMDFYKWLAMHPHPEGYINIGEVTHRLLFIGKYSDGNIQTDHSLIFATHVEPDAVRNESLTQIVCKEDIRQFKHRLYASYTRLDKLVNGMPTFINFVRMCIKAFESNKYIRFEQQIVSKLVIMALD
jgi:hypothetical protein